MSEEKKILAAIMAASFITPFSSSALTLSLPDIGREFAAPPQLLAWILTGYLLANVVCLLPLGRVADRLGKRRVFLSGMWLSGLTALAGAFSTGIGAILLWRSLQGVGTSMLFATNMSLLTLVVPKERRGRAIGWNVAVVYTGLALGPVIGGLMNYYLGWRSIFLFLAAASLVAAALSERVIKREWRAAAPPPADTPGALLYGLGMAGVMFGLSELMGSPLALPALLLGLVFFALFLRHELALGESALLPLHLFRTNRAFTLSSLTAMLNYSATFALTFLLSLYLQNLLGFTSREAGTVLLVQPVVMALLSPQAGRLSDKYSAALLTSAGMGIIAAGLVLLIPVLAHASLPLLALLLVLIGAGFALFGAPNNNAIMSAVPPRYYSLASSMLGTVRLVGQVLSCAIVTLLLSLRWDAPAEASLLHSIELSFVVFAVLCVLGIVPSLARRAAKSAPPEER